MTANRAERPPRRRKSTKTYPVIRPQKACSPLLLQATAEMAVLRGVKLAGFERLLRAMARENIDARRLMSTPGVGVMVSMTFVAAVDALERFRSSWDVGSHFRLTPRKYQSGETDRSGRISKVAMWGGGEPRSMRQPMSS